MGAGNAGVAVAINKHLVQTFLAQGVSIGSPTCAPDITLNAVVNSDAKAFTLGVAGGAVAVGAAVALTKTAPTVYTYIGAAPDATTYVTPGTVNGGSITIRNDVRTSSESYAANVNGGAVGITAQVLLVFNTARVFAGLDRIHVNAGNVNIDSALHADGRAYVASLTGGAAAVGMVVSTVLLQAENIAQVDVTGVEMNAANLNVHTGRQNDPNTSSAEALAIAAGAGAVSVGLNAAVADNNTKNITRILGGKEALSHLLNVNGAVNLGSYGQATANAQVWGVNAGAISVLGSAAVAMLRAQQQANVAGGNITAGSLTARSEMNEGLEHMKYVDLGKLPGGNIVAAPAEAVDASEGNAAVFAGLITGSGGAISAVVNVAAAYGRALTQASVQPFSLVLSGKADVFASGTANVLAQSFNQSVGAITAAVIVDTAYSQSEFVAILDIPAGSSVTAGSVSVATDYTAGAVAALAPSAGGAELSGAQLQVNVGVANADSRGKAAVTGAGVLSVGTLTVTGSGIATSRVYSVSPVASLTGIKIAANVLVALLDAENLAYIQGVEVKNAAINVNAQLNAADGQGASVLLANNIKGSGVSVSLASARSNTAVALNSSINKAFLDAVKVTTGGALSVTATANSLATASAADPGTSVELLSLGVNVIIARADGTFAAYIHLAEDRPVTAASVTVTNTYTARAEAVSRQPNQGVGLLDAGVNVAYANAGTVAESAIRGSAGSLITGGAVNILLSGKATADARIPGTKVNVQGAELAVNVVNAIVSANQQAYIGLPEGGAASSLSVTAMGGILIQASLNDSTETGARAIVGSNGSDHSVGVSIIGGVASEANARMEGSSSAHILTTGSIVTTGQLALRNAARSWAKADIDDDSVDVTLVNATLLLTKAIAGGSFQALADTGSLSAGDVDIQNKYYAESYAASGPAGGVGVTLVSTDANRAAAETSAKANASVKVSGNASVTNSVNIQNIGYLLADALGRTRKVNVSGVSIAVTVVDAVLKAGQTAGAQFDGETQVGGAVNVNSEIVRTGGYGIATAQAGGSGGANVSLVGAGVNHVTAKSSTANTVFLQGAGTLSAGNVSVRAKSLTEAQAIAKSNVNVGLVLLGSLNAASSTHDKVDVLVDGILVNASGTFTAEAVGNTISDAVAASEGGGGLVTSGINTANAKVGGSETDPQTVRIIVRDSIIQAVRDITLRAYNTGNARANIERGLNVAAGNLSVSVLPTNAWYDTGVEVLEGSEVRSTEGNVSVLSEDAPKGRSEARGTSIGIGVNSNVTYGENTADTTNTIRIHGILDAGEALIVEAISSAQLNAATYADGGGFFEGTMLWSKNTLNRVVSILVEENSTLLANYGDLVISAEGGTRDSILTRSEVSSGGVVALGTATALVNIDNRVTVQIGENVLIRARFSQVDICADASQTGVATNVSADASGLGVAPNSTANVNTNLDADVIVGKTGGELAVIEGKDVEIIARNGEVDIYTYTYAKGSALGAAVNAISNPKTTLRADVRIDGADITGHDNLHIYASVKPAYRDANISVHAIIQLNAVGEALAKAGGATNASSNTILGSGVTLRGAVVAVTRYGFDGGRIRRDARKGGFIVKEAVASHSFSSGGTVSVSGDTVLYLGDAAGGIYIDISEHKGQLTVREVGVKNPDKFYEQNGNVITFSDISNNLPGMADFSHDGHDANGSILVYNQAVLPRVILTNSSHFDVQLNGIYVSNSGFIQPSVFGIRHTIKDVVYDKPEVRTEFSGTGGVKVSGFVSNTDGHVEFIWTGEEGGALTGVDGVTNISSGTTVSPVWAHDLLVKGAASVGTADQAFNAYVFSGSNGVVNIEAYGDVFVNIVPVTLILVDENNQVLERHEDPVYIERVVSLSGNVKMDLKEAVQATMIVGTTTVTIPLPGSLSYITDATVELASAYTLTGKDVLDYYLQGYDASERLYRYLLPNGTLFYMDAWGNVSRIEEGGTETAVGDFEFIKDTSDKVVQIKLNEGISIDLSTGYLTVAEDASYEVLLEAISASWFTSQGLLSGGGEARIRLVTAGTVSGNQGENLTDEDTLKEMDVRVVLALSTAQIDYYYLSGLQPTMDAITGAPATTYYYFLLHDKGTDSLRFYAFTGGSTEIQNVDQVNRDSFNREHLQVYDGHPVTNTLNNGVTYYEAQFDSVARDTHEWRSGTHLGKVLRNASGDPFTVTDFLGTGYEVVWNSNNTMSIDGTAVGLVYIPGLGYTVAPGQNLSGQAAGLYQALAGIYWMPSVERTVESSVQVDGMTYTANGKDNGVDVFRFAEFVYTRLNNNKDKPTTQMYRTKTFCMYSYWLQFTYVKMQPVTASLSNEYYTSGVKYTGFDKTVYEKPDGTLYEHYDVAKDEYTGKLTPEAEYRIVSQVYYMKDANGSRISVNGQQIWSYLSEATAQIINGKCYYLVDSHPGEGLYLEKTTQNGEDVYTLMSQTISAPETVLPEDESHQHDTGDRTFIVGQDDEENDITVTFKPDNNATGETEYEDQMGSDGNYYTIVFKAGTDGNPGKWYLRISSGSDTLLNDPTKVLVNTSYAVLKRNVYDSDGNPTGETTNYLLDGVQAYIDFAPERNKTGINYQIGTLDASGTLVPSATGLYAIWDGSHYLLFDPADMFEHYGTDNSGLTAELVEEREATGNTLLRTEDGQVLRSAAGETVYLNQMEKGSYSTAEDVSGGLLILRPGSPVGADEEPSVLIIGPLEDIPVKEITLPANSQVNGGGYRITDTLYLTKSGLVVTLALDDAGQVTFSAKFDGSTYTSDKIIAAQLGHLGTLREYTLNEEGKRVYTVNGKAIAYTLNGDQLSYIDENGRLVVLTPQESMEILYQNLPMANDASITIKAGEKLYLERLTDQIAKDLAGNYYYSENGENGWMRAEFTEQSGTKTYHYAGKDQEHQLMGTVRYGGNVYLTISEAMDANETSATFGQMILYYELDQKQLLVGSDGSVTLLGENSQTLKLEPDDEVEYLFGYVSAGEALDGTEAENRRNVTIQLSNEKGSLVDGDAATGHADDIDIRTNGGDVIILVPKSADGTIGMDLDALEIDTNGGLLLIQSYVLRTQVRSPLVKWSLATKMLPSRLRRLPVLRALPMSPALT